MLRVRRMKERGKGGKKERERESSREEGGIPQESRAEGEEGGIEGAEN